MTAGLIAGGLIMALVTAASPTAEPPPTITFGVQPANAAGGVDQRAIIQYDLAPQTTVFDYVGVINYGDAPVELSVYPTDAGTDPATGAFSPAGREETPRDVGAWLDIGEDAVTVPAASADGPGTVVLPLTITVPADATPGDHSGAVVAASITRGGSEAANVRLEQRVAVRVYLRVAGESAPGLTLSDVVASYRPATLPWRAGVVDVTYRVTNAGNLRLGVQPSIQVRGLAEERATPAPLAELLPGATTQLRQTVGGVRALGAVEATVRLEALASPGTQPPDVAPVTATVTDWSVPWSLLAAAVVVLLIALALIRRRGTRSADQEPADLVP